MKHWIKDLENGFIEILLPNAMVESCPWHWKTTSEARRTIDQGKLEIGADNVWWSPWYPVNGYKFTIEKDTNYLHFYLELKRHGTLSCGINLQEHL